MLLLNDGSAALMTGASSAEQSRLSHGSLSAARHCAGRGGRASACRRIGPARRCCCGRRAALVATDAQFNFRWLVGLVLQERRSLRDIGLASLTISVLTIFPPLLVMATVNKVLQFHSMSTLVLLSAIMAIIFAYETLLGYARRLIISVVGARLDTKLRSAHLQPAAAVAARLFRASSGRRNHVSASARSIGSASFSPANC